MTRDASEFHGSYDLKTDVLYLRIGEVCEVETEPRVGGVELGFKLETDDPARVLVVGFRRNGWTANIGNLADIVSDHLGIAPLNAMRVIEELI